MHTYIINEYVYCKYLHPDILDSLKDIHKDRYTSARAMECGYKSICNIGNRDLISAQKRPYFDFLACFKGTVAPD
jgi:hypothetical protein